ncbi:MAG: hypothetical protein JSV69_12535 [Chloroflexota bacterium]|nr:MAG: hypothetical protein JSV69_12535 [Chloroflexota bacterium]
MSKEELATKFLSNTFVLSELFTIIPGDGMGAISNGLEKSDHGLADHHP